MHHFVIVIGVVSTLGFVALVFGSISILCSNALSFGLTLSFVGNDGLGVGGGMLSFGNIDGIVLFIKVVISINSLLVSSPYVGLCIFDCGDLMISRGSAVVF